MSVASALTRVVMEDPAPSSRVVDPACGDGVFLLAAAEAMRRAGASVERIVAEQLFGIEIDSGAVEVARERLHTWAQALTGDHIEIPAGHLVVADGLDSSATSNWAESMDVVIGNPPFGSQLKSLTVRSAEAQRRLAERFDLGALGYADTAGLFLLRAFELVRPGGVVSLILPTSLLAARDAEGIRGAVARQATITAVWIGGDDVGFDAAVSVWAPVLSAQEPRASTIEVPRYRGAEVAESGRVVIPVDPNGWPSVLADPVEGIDDTTLTRLFHTEQTLGDVATSTAGFRHHYYGLVPFVRDDPDRREPAMRQLVTTGAIDPLRHRCDVPVRFAKRRFARPVVDVSALRDSDPGLADWVDGLVGPKVLVASQGRVIEAFIDADGTLVPSTPVIALIAGEDSGCTESHLAALVTSPIAAAILHRRAAGSGMGRGNCRVTAALLASLPLPSDRGAWDVGAAAAERAQRAAAAADVSSWEEELDAVGEAMTVAYGFDRAHPVISWWRDQRPGWRNARRLRA